ncbi:MAG: hypothetical protein ACFFC0_10005 [Promethearchaeota archaeon]
MQKRYLFASLVVLVFTVVTRSAEAVWTTFGGLDAQNEPRLANDFGPILVAKETMRR